MTIQEIILEVMKARNDRVAAGLKPTVVILSKSRYQELMLYHASLGDMPEGQPDYISKDTLFDLNICLDSSVDFKVL